MRDRAVLIAERNLKADRAWDRALASARRPLGDPKRVPYPKAVTAALAAYDAVVAKYRPLIWPDG